MDFLQPIVDFFNHPIFIIVGGLTVVIAAIGIIYRASCLIFGISPLVLRIGIALWRRKIAIIGTADAFSSLSGSLKDSGIIKGKNMCHIPLDNIDKCKDFTIFLVDWETSSGFIDQILASRSNHHTAVIIFAKPATIPADKMNDIANRSNTIVVNFKGRLSNDILNSLVTTSFDGK